MNYSKCCVFKQHWKIPPGRKRWRTDCLELPQGLGESEQPLLHNPAPSRNSRGTHCDSSWICWRLTILTSWDTLGWPVSTSRLGTGTVSSSGLTSPLNPSVLFLFSPGLLTGRYTHTEISIKIKSGISFLLLSTHPFWWAHGFASFHVEGSLFLLYEQIYPLIHMKSGVYQMPSLCCCISHCPGEEAVWCRNPWHCSPNDWAQLQHCRDKQGEQQEPKWKRKYLRVIKGCAPKWFRCF